MNSLRMSFWMVPASLAGGTPCSSPATMYSASTGSTAPFMVIDTVIWSSGNAGEQRAHVVDGIDRHAGHADVAAHARMVAVVAAMGGEIEGDRQALLPGRDVAAVEGVGILGRREAGVLADGPRLRDVHGRVRPAQERRDAGIAVDEVEAGDVGGRIGLLHRDAFGRQPGIAAALAAAAAAAADPPSSTLVKSGIRLMRSCLARNGPHSTVAVPEI